MNLGLPQLPEWFVRLFFALACFGALTIIGGIGYGIYYLATHLTLK